MQVDGVVALALSSDLDELAVTRPTDLVRLLPAFDPYVLGAGTANSWVVDASRRGAVSRAGGWISPVILAGGRVAGTWTSDGAALAAELFSEQAGAVARQALEGEAQRIGATAIDIRLV